MHLLKDIHKLLPLQVGSLLKIGSGLCGILGLLGRGSLLHFKMCLHLIHFIVMIISMFTVLPGRVIHCRRLCCHWRTIRVIIVVALANTRLIRRSSLIIGQCLQIVLHYVFLLGKHFWHELFQDLVAQLLLFIRVRMAAALLVLGTLKFIG